MRAHLVECLHCNGVGEVIISGHPNDPYAESDHCDICDGTGTVPHDDAFCDACAAVEEANRILEHMPC